MALEYTFEASPEVAGEELHRFVQQTTAAEPVDPGSPLLRTAGMDVLTFAVDPDSPREREDHVPGAGFLPRMRVVFRMHNLASEPDRQAALAAMLSTVLGFFDAYGGDGLLLYNGERVVLSRHDGEVVFDTWEGIDEEPSLASAAAAHPRQKLPQPFL